MYPKLRHFRLLHHPGTLRISQFVKKTHTPSAHFKLFLGLDILMNKAFSGFASTSESNIFEFQFDVEFLGPT